MIIFDFHVLQLDLILKICSCFIDVTSYLIPPFTHGFHEYIQVLFWVLSLYLKNKMNWSPLVGISTTQVLLFRDLISAK